MSELVIAILIIAGAILMFLAGLGITRMPDLFLRMSATTKVATLGLGTIMLAVTIYFNDLVATSHAVATILFVFLSAPVAAHIIGRAAYFAGVPLWEGTITDELRGHYDIRTHQLESIPLPDLKLHLPDLQVHRFRIPERSPLAGNTLAEIDLRRKFDFSILAIRRDDLVIPNPSGDVQLFMDDELILIGPAERLNELADLLHSVREEIGKL